MLKRILVLLGDTPSSTAAQEFAIGLARTAQAELLGLAGIDLTRIESRMPGGIGTSAYLHHRDETLRHQADDLRRRMHEAFPDACRKLGVRFSWLSFEGDAVEAIRSAAEGCDLVVTGHDTAFSGNLREPVAPHLAKLLMIAPRPLIVCPDELPSGAATMVAYDASVPSMRAVQLFALLGIGRGREIAVVSVDPLQEAAARRSAGAASFLRGHGYQATDNPIASSAQTAELLRNEAAGRKSGLMVTGAYGHNGLRELLFGSTTGALLEQPPCPLFLYH